MDAFDKLAPFIKDYIYSHHWESLRDIQVKSCDAVFNHDTNILLAASTASGKTEAAFLPTITEIYNDPPKSVGILYVSPLKALINDQFIRLEELCEHGEIKVTKWHGDVSQYAKDKLIKNPSGILQTTPESLEATVTRNPDVAYKLFSDLRFIVIDEVHHFMNDDRGDQLLCIMERMQRIAGCAPRRIGLSATLGDYTFAEHWLNAGTKRSCITPVSEEGDKSIRLSTSYYLCFPLTDDPDVNLRNESVYYKHLYEATKGHRCIIFSNSKAEVETNISNLKALAKINNTPDIYHVHHGSISANLREETEHLMKEGEGDIVTGATLTLEMGIDLGAMERIIQTGAPHSVSSFVQRLGRSGRRSGKPEMAFTFLEHDHAVPVEFFKAINWPFIRTIAIIELYVRERWIEPISQKTLPYSLLYHQTLSHLYSHGDISPAKLCQDMLTMSKFKSVSKDDFKALLLQMLKDDSIEKSERGGLLIGVKGEPAINNYDFFSVFKSRVEYKVRYRAEDIGTVTSQFEPGMKFALAGHTWQVQSTDEDTHIIYVMPSSGVSENKWNGFMTINLHTHILKKMQEIIASDDEYSYLTENAKNRLKDFRKIAREHGIGELTVIYREDNSYLIFPWLGTSAMLALSYALQKHGISNSIANEVAIEINESIDGDELMDTLEEIKSEQIDKSQFAIPQNVRPLMSDKYNQFIPLELLKKQYIADYINVEDMQNNLNL